MGIRESLNRNPALTTGVTVLLIVVAIGAIVWQIWPQSGGPIGNRRSYYTEDDGKNYFDDDRDKVTPFQGPGGKQAVLAHVFQVGENTPAVAFLEKFSDEGKKKVDAAMSGWTPKKPLPAEFYDTANRVAKRPGATFKWVPATHENIIKLRPAEGHEVFPPPKQ